MKKIIAIAALGFSSFLIFGKCCQAQKKAVVATVQNVEMHWLDLSPSGINALIQVPVTVKIMDDPYDIIIGDGKNIFIEISTTTQSFDQVKSFVEKNTVRGFKKFVKQDDNGFVAEMNAFGQKEFDFSFYAGIGSEHYLLKDPGKYHHGQIDIVNAMYSYAKTIKAK